MMDDDGEHEDNADGDTANDDDDDDHDVCDHDVCDDDSIAAEDHVFCYPFANWPAFDIVMGISCI